MSYNRRRGGLDPARDGQGQKLGWVRARNCPNRSGWRRCGASPFARNPSRATQKAAASTFVVQPVNHPRLIVIAGANGSGKSTLTRSNRIDFREFTLLDPDAISKALQPSIPGASAVAAARQVLVSAGKHIEKSESFAVETTLSGRSYLRLMVDARIRGFEVVLVYIGTENVEIN